MDLLEPAPHMVAALEKQHKKAMITTEKAVCVSPGQYLEIKKTVDHILTHPIDVGDYYDISLQLAQMIQSFGTNTIFYPYYYENLHPNINGRAKYFRSICRDLKNQLDQFTDHRKQQRHLQVVK